MRYTFQELSRCPGFRFHVQRSVFPERSFELHSHEFMELVVVRHGRAVHLLEGRRFPVMAGDVFVVMPDHYHAYEDMEGLDIFNIGFDPRLFPDDSADLSRLPGFHALFRLEPLLRGKQELQSRLRLTKEQMYYVNDLLAALEEEYEQQRTGFQTVIRAHFTLLAAYLARQYANQGQGVDPAILRLSRVLSFIESHYHEPLTLDILAREACMSKASLARAFRRCYGVSPVAYVNQQRLQKSLSLLEDPHVSVTQAAYAVGFTDSNYFARRFRQHFGRSPREFRRYQ